MKWTQRLRQKAIQKSFGALCGIERLVHGVSINVASRAFLDDPYTSFNAMRDKAPLHYSMALRGYWVTSFEYVQEVLLDKRFGADVRAYEDRAARLRATIDNPEDLASFDNPSMLNLDPPDHTRIRKLVTHGFTRSFIESMAPRIQSIVDDCLNQVDNQPSFDVVDKLAKPLPAIVIAEMMGLPEGDHAQFQEWSEELIVGAGSSDPDDMERSNRASRALVKYFAGIIEARRDQPGDDLIGTLMRAEEAGDKLNAQELYNTCLLVLVAGHETTTRLIGNGLFLLLRHPEQLAYLREHPDQIDTAVEEMLRFEPPVQATQRFVREDMDFHGTRLKRGDIVFVGIAGANRDPAEIPDPENFDIRREKVRQVSFGYGIHLCIGAHLARMEAKIALLTLLDRFDEIALVGEANWGDNPFFRGFDELTISGRRMVSSVA